MQVALCLYGLRKTSCVDGLLRTLRLFLTVRLGTKGITMKRLFMLRHGKGGAIVRGDDGNPLFYSSKPDAKKARKDGQVVSFGPDHNKFKGVM